MKVKKAIIPAAGLGTRFLPATKAQPKEMLPIVDQPAIQYIVEEAVAAGIEDILIISGRGKRAIEDHFDKSFELEEVLEQKGKTDLLHQIRAISEMANIHYIRQKEAKGLGHAVWCAKTFIGDEPFAVMLGDDIIQSDPPCIRQLMDIYEQTRMPVIGVQQVAESDISKYGVIDPAQVEEQIIKIKALVEKPSSAFAPSLYAIMGRYVLTREIFDILENQKPGAGGEIQLTDALNRLNACKQIAAIPFSGQRYDTGDKFGFIQATLDFALRRDDLREPLSAHILNLAEQILAKKAK